MSNGFCVVPSAKNQWRDNVRMPGDVWKPPVSGVAPGPNSMVLSATIGCVAITRIPNPASGRPSATVTTVRCNPGIRTSCSLNVPSFWMYVMVAFTVVLCGLNKTRNVRVSPSVVPSAKYHTRAGCVMPGLSDISVLKSIKRSAMTVSLASIIAGTLVVSLKILLTTRSKRSPASTVVVRMTSSPGSRSKRKRTLASFALVFSTDRRSA